MIRVITISGLLFLACISLLEAQTGYPNWFFGKKAGLFFQGNSTLALVSGQLNTTEGCASISDSSGHLLFYTNGIDIWNKNHAPMLNGSGLYGDVSATQSAAIIPHPAFPHLFYVVTTGEWSQNVGLRYSVVDMNQANGLGSTIGPKNVSLASNISERMAVIAHANKKDYWLLAHRQNTNEFLAFLIDAGGIQGMPVSSMVGSPDSSAVGYLKASLDGKKLAMAFRNQHFYEIYDFNPATGTVSNAINLPAIFYQSYGCEFSPNGSKLYIHSSRIEQNAQPSQLFQLDLTGNSAWDIVSSVTLIGNINVQHPGAMQLGPDGRIYLARHNAFYLGVIQNPNAPGSACNFTDEGFYLGGKKSQFGLPNLIQSKILPAPQILADQFCSSDSTFFLAENLFAVDSVIWDFGDPTSGQNVAKELRAFHTYTQPGTYQARMIFYRGRHADTLYQQIDILPQPFVDLGKDTSICPREVLELDATHASTSILQTHFLWQDNSQNRVHIADQEGWFWVEASNICGTYRDSIHFAYRKLPQVDLGKDQLLCEGENLFLEITTENPSLYLWDNGQNSSWRNIDQSGTYWVYVQDACGSDKDTIEVVFEQKPIFDLGKDTLICEGESFKLDARPLQNIAYNYLWNDGETSAIRHINQTGTYKVMVSSQACSAEDSMSLHVRNLPFVELGKDTIICASQPLMLHASGEASTYIWQNGARSASIYAKNTGIYWVRASNSCGTVYDEVKIEVHRQPRLDLGKDTLICIHYPLTLDVSSSAGDVSYLWENGSTFPYHKISQSGFYSVSLSNRCGVVTDTIEVKASLEACDCKLFIPNVITPNDDGVNDRFVIHYPCEFKYFQLNIFDRWGKHIFHTENPEHFWDGSSKKLYCPNGTYFYVISYQGKDSFLRQDERRLNTLKGAITLLR